MRNLMVLALLMLTSYAQAEIKVIYGEDNRIDPINSDNAVFVELSKSTAAMIPSQNLSKDIDREIKVTGVSLTSRGMCKSERFSSQMTAAHCSGFLVSENLLVTAGHCIRSQSDCNSYRWVFDYAVEKEDQFDLAVPANSVYSCKKIISRTLDSWSKDDWALIELDRKVTDRRPLTFRKSGKIETGAELVVIGHPSGLPTKIADGAKVRSLDEHFFVANLDTYGGNSGSAVLNIATGEVEGILVRGAMDYVYDSTQGCRASNYLGDDEGRGEDVTYITNIPELRNL